MATKADVQNCINTIAPYAVAEYKKGKLIFPSVCIAQACCESAFLTSPKMRNANAVFGIKVGASKYHFGTAWKGKAYSTKTKECYDGSTYVTITDMFRAYDTIQESVEDYYDMLCHCKRYKAAVGAATPLATITAIKNGGYATSPTYINTITHIINKYDLTKYDKTDVVIPVKPIVEDDEFDFKVGRTYTLNNNMFVRVEPAGEKKLYSELTVDGKKNSTKQTDGSAVMKKSTRVTCQAIQIVDGSTWIKIPSGWLCGIGKNGTKYIS